MHPFIFEPGIWEGSGLLRFSMAADEIPFVMRWTVEPSEEGKIHFEQIVDIQELNQKMRNKFCISEKSSNRFHIQLNNAVVERVLGIGVLDPKTIAWEFREQGKDFEGFEVYEKQEDGSYKMHGEYAAPDSVRTHVTGVISKKD